MMRVVRVTLDGRTPPTWVKRDDRTRFCSPGSQQWSLRVEEEEEGRSRTPPPAWSPAELLNAGVLAGSSVAT